MAFTKPVFLSMSVTLTGLDKHTIESVHYKFMFYSTGPVEAEVKFFTGEACAIKFFTAVTVAAS
jgi:hypothetical protein